MKMWIIIALTFALCAPALADEAVTSAGCADLTSGKADYTESTVGVYVPEAHGSQAWVRQYDGRSFVPGIGLESFDSIGYDGDIQYFIRAYDLSLGDQSAYTKMMDRNIFSMDWDSVGLTQNFAPVPSVNPALIGTPANSTKPGIGDYRVNLDSSGELYYLDRRENDFDMKLTPWGGPQARFYTSWFQVQEGGVEQLQFETTKTIPGVVVSGQKALIGLPIDRNTNQNTIGTDFLIGGSSVGNYYFQNTKYRAKPRIPFRVRAFLHSTP